MTTTTNTRTASEIAHDLSQMCAEGRARIESAEGVLPYIQDQDLDDCATADMAHAVWAIMSAPTKTYRITSSAGQDMGVYAASDVAGALDAMAQDAGYASQAEAAAEAGAFEGTVKELDAAAYTIEATITTRSDCMPEAPEARDVGVTVAFGDGSTIDGEVTLLPAQDGSGYTSWGSPSNWIESGFLARLTERFGEKLSDVLGQIAGEAGALADETDVDDDDARSTYYSRFDNAESASAFEDTCLDQLSDEAPARGTAAYWVWLGECLDEQERQDA